MDWNILSLSQSLSIRSHLLQMRGLKLKCKNDRSFRTRRIFYRCVDWNNINPNIEGEIRSRIFYRCVDWNWKAFFIWSGDSSRIFYRCVDWNKNLMLQRIGKPSRIFYRCVDWNLPIKTILLIKDVASFTDAWIETSKKIVGLQRKKSRIFYRCVDWNSKME